MPYRGASNLDQPIKPQAYALVGLRGRAERHDAYQQSVGATVMRRLLSYTITVLACWSRSRLDGRPDVLGGLRG
jgi:hypothetical protein